MTNFNGALFVFCMALLLSTPSLAQTSGYSGSSGTTLPMGAPAPDRPPTTALGVPILPTTPAVATPAVASPAVAAPAIATPQVMSPTAPVAPTPPANIASTLPGAPPAQPVVDTQKTDPCAQYMYAYNAYVTCQDRMQKIDRMKAASAKRIDAYKAPPPAAAPAATPAAAAATPAAGAKAAEPAAAGATPAAAAAATPATTLATTPPATTEKK